MQAHCLCLCSSNRHCCCLGKSRLVVSPLVENEKFDQGSLGSLSSHIRSSETGASALRCPSTTWQSPAATSKGQTGSCVTCSDTKTCSYTFRTIASKIGELLDPQSNPYTYEVRKCSRSVHS